MQSLLIVCSLYSMYCNWYMWSSVVFYLFLALSSEVTITCRGNCNSLAIFLLPGSYIYGTYLQFTNEPRCKWCRILQRFPCNFDKSHKIEEPLGRSQVSPSKESSDVKSSCIYLRIKWKGGQPLPSFLFTEDVVADICEMKTRTQPGYVEMLNEYECILEFPSEIVVTPLIIMLAWVVQWLGIV